MEADYVGTDGTSSTVNGSNSSIENSHTPPVNTINVTTNGSQENDVPAASHNGTVEINGHAATDASAGGDRVLIVGAGPVGLLLALRLGQAGINATVIEKEASTSDLPRACGYAAIVQFALDEAGVYEKMKQIGGFITAGPCWRKGPIENKAGGKDLGPIFAAFKRYRDDDPSWPPGSGTLNLPQAELSRLLYREAVATGRVTVRFNAELDSIKDDGQSVTIGVKDTVSRDIFHLTGTYLVGADGGRSKTRALLGIAFAGHTWPGKLLATDVWVRNSEEGLHPTSYLLDPVHFCVITPLTEPKLGETTLWRYAIGLPPNDPRPDEEVLKTEHIASLYEKVMAGPRPLKYRITNRTVYHIHQRLAATLRRGRCVLAGDAAHVNNPIGALGLNTGFLDGEALYESLIMILKEGKSDKLLDIYSDERRRVFQMFVDPMSTYNYLRLTSLHPDTATEDDWFFKALKNQDQRVLKQVGKGFTELWPTNMRELAQQAGI